jgi:2-dehydro-3-deoxyglucarate aldolase/4-hydroxy-2-oxoheptanedioate aldolase
MVMELPLWTLTGEIWHNRYTASRQIQEPDLTEADKKQIPKIGCWLTMANPKICEVLAAAGYDAVFIDGEHGTFSPESIDLLVLLARSLSLEAYVRVATPTRPHVQQALDAGAAGLVLPQIRDFAHAREAAEFTKYPPLGSRGMGTPRSLNYRDTPPNFVDRENEGTKCLIMIETSGALRDVREIVQLPTVDGLFMGPYDLSLSRGRGPYAANVDDDADAHTIAKAATEFGKIIGVPAFSDRDIERALEFRAEVITIGDDVSMLTESLRSNYLRVTTILDNCEKSNELEHRVTSPR